jgi:hypothetical protein
VAWLYKLKTDMTEHELPTVVTIISRWAPANRNKTDDYIQVVAKKVSGGDAAKALKSDKETAIKLTLAIIHHENGQQPYDYKPSRRRFTMS